MALARLGRLGDLPAPGTWGSMAGMLFFFLGFTQLGIVSYFVIAAAAAYFAVGVCGQAEIELERKDPGEVIFDEFVSMPVCFIGWQMIVGPSPRVLSVLGLLAAGFVLFRLFDIWKPGPIRRLQDLPGGWGVVLDDTAAALVTCGLLHAGHLLRVLV
jgi:phosphatidylglycerophosphatase A